MPKRAIFDKKNVVVTGGAGFIGSHLCDELVKENKVICIDNFSTGDLSNIDHLLSNPNFVFVKADITDLPDLEEMPDLQPFKIQFQGVQEIYNAACPMSPADFEKNKVATALANSSGLRNVLALAAKYQAMFLQFSSSVVYGTDQRGGTPVSETDIGSADPAGARAVYDEGKRFAESMALAYAEAYHFEVKIARIFRTYGPRMKLGDQQMIPDFINDALEGKNLTIYGDESFSTSMCYVADVIDALVKMAYTETTGPINIGSDTAVRLSDVAQKIIALTESAAQIQYEDTVMFMTPLAIPDIGRAKEQLGWMPVTTLEKGLIKTVDDLRAAKGLLGVKQAVS